MWPGRGALSPLFLAICLYCLRCWCTVDCASDVRIIRYDCPSEARNLRKLGRIAIWNMKKIIIAIAMIIWVADVTLLVHGKYFLRIMELSPIILVMS